MQPPAPSNNDAHRGIFLVWDLLLILSAVLFFGAAVAFFLEDYDGGVISHKLLAYIRGVPRVHTASDAAGFVSFTACAILGAVASGFLVSSHRRRPASLYPAFNRQAHWQSGVFWLLIFGGAALGALLVAEQRWLRVCAVTGPLLLFLVHWRLTYRLLLSRKRGEN